MASTMSEVKRIRVLLRHTYRGPAWHGPAVRELLAEVDAETAAAHPIAGAHSIWELVLHMAYWRRTAAAALAVAAVDSEPPAADNFPPVDDAGDQAWERAKEVLAESQRTLVAALKTFDAERLNEHVQDREYTFYFLLHGIIQHDIYHGGQIALLKKAQLA